MSSRYVVRALILAGLLPAGAMALGLGDIHLKSALNAPLDAEIDLTATAEELRGLKVALATRESFSRYGLDYPSYFDSVTLVPGKSADGHDVLQVRSTSVATEPFATLLVEATWARGRLVREYTVLLDPPVFTGDKASASAAVSAPEVAEQARSGSVERTEPAPSAAPSAPSSSTTPVTAGGSTAAPSAAPGSYTVQRGDTLSAIAAQHYPNAERERALVALFKANPAAFEGNMNELHAGASLQIPDESSLAAIAPGEATAEVNSQYRSWAGTHAEGGRLHLVPPSEPGTASAGKAGAGDTAALQERVNTLQAQLTESQRLLEVKNAELARLQQQLNPGKAAPPPPPAVAPAPAKPPEVAAPAPTPEQAAPPVAEAPAATAHPPVKHAPPAATGGGLTDWLVSNWYVVLGVLLVLAAALFGVRKFKARRESDFGSTIGRLSHPAFDNAASSASRPAETQPMRTLQSKQDSSFVVEESGTHPVPRTGGGDSAPLRPVPVAVDDALSASGTAVALDQGDPLAEADFHMAYGLYDQAADLVRIAISREPQRRDLQLKLLEVFFVWGNKEQFLQLARELSANRDQAIAGEWEKIVIMGRQIAPEDALFASAGALPGVASGGVDLNLEGGQNRVDFDLLGEPSVTTESSGDAVDLDLGAALGGTEATGEARAVGDTGVDFILDDPARGNDATGSTREMVQSPTVTLDFGDPSADSPTVENLITPNVDSPTIRQKLDASTRNMLQSPDPTAEVAVVDLGLQFSGGDTGLHPISDSDSSSTAMTSLDEETRELFSSAQSESNDTQLMPSSPGGTASGTWLFTDKEVGLGLPTPPADDAPTALATAIMPGTAAGQGLTAQLEALKGQGGGDVDLDLGGLDMTGEPGGALDLDVGQGSAQGEAAFTATQKLSSPPIMNESEPATMSEVGTKLDLARAYMDMGDPEGARSILEEVLAEGSASQKTEARRLVDSLPGLTRRPMGRVAIGVEYDGAAYHGWQRQPHSASVQEALQAALSRIANVPVELTCAGRTDAGVHARAQVAHFDTEAERSPRAWLFGANSVLPPAINLRWVQPVPEQFHARYSALRRTYRYLVLNRPTRSALACGRALVVYAPLDAALMQLAANALIGEHDFSAFRASECQAHSPVRTIESLDVRRRGDWVSIEVTANAFLQHMVRNIAGTLLAVGRGEVGPQRTREQLESRQRSTGEATAAAHGLYFWRVQYPAEFGLPDDSGMIDFYPLAEVHAP